MFVGRRVIVDVEFVGWGSGIGIGRFGLVHELTVADSRNLGYKSSMPIADHMKQVLGRPMGRIPSGVYILTAAAGDHHVAMLASWVQQASFDPPCLSIAVAKDRPVLDAIRKSGRLALSILPEKDTTLMKKYARGFAPGEDAFAGVTIVTYPGAHHDFDRPNLAAITAQLETTNHKREGRRHWMVYNCAHCGGLVTAASATAGGSSRPGARCWSPFPTSTHPPGGSSAGTFPACSYLRTYITSINRTYGAS